MINVRLCRIRIGWLLLYSLACRITASAQDTSFVDFMPFQGSIISMAGDGDGTIWFNSKNIVYTFDGKKIQKTGAMEARECLMYYNGELQTFEGLTRQGVTVLEPWKENMHWAKFIPGASTQIFTARDKEGRIWVTNGQDLHAFRIHRSFKISLPGLSVRGILPSDRGIYVGTYDGLFLNEELMGPDFLYSNGNILPLDEHQLLIPDRNLLIFNVEDQSLRRVYVQMALRKNREMELSCIAKAYDAIWAGSTLGLLKWEGDSLMATSLSVGVQNLFFKDGLLYLATNRGIYTWNGKTQERLSAFPEIKYNDIQKIGDTWWACSKSGLWTWDGSHHPARMAFSNLPVSGLETYCITKDEAGYLWVSTISGLIRFLPGSTSYELFFPNKEFNARSVASVGDTLYFGTVNGLVQFNPMDLPKANLQQEVAPYLSSRKITFLLGIALVLSAWFILLLFRKWKTAERALLEKAAVSESPPQDDLMASLEAYIEANLSMVTVESLCQHSGLPLKSLYRALESRYGIKPGDLIRNIKLRHIQELLAENPDVDREVLANRVGYSVHHINRLLKK